MKVRCLPVLLLVEGCGADRNREIVQGTGRLLEIRHFALAAQAHRAILGAITKQGNGYLRMLLVQAAWNIMRSKHGDPLKSWATQVAEHGARA